MCRSSYHINNIDCDLETLENFGVVPLNKHNLSNESCEDGDPNPQKRYGRQVYINSRIISSYVISEIVP